MANTYWRKQEDYEPLFPDILWSRPQTKHGSGKLAIIGGNSHGFNAPGLAYSVALESGAGVCNVLLPDAIKKTVRLVLPDADYAPSNPSGSFSKQALAQFIEISNWGDAALLAGDLGRNSETAALLESYAASYQGMLTVTQDAADYFKSTPKFLLERPDTLLVVSLAQLQKIFINAPLITPITHSMTLAQLAEALYELTLEHPASIVVKHGDFAFVAADGQVTSTIYKDEIWRIKTAARASIFWMQNEKEPLAAITSSLLQPQAE